MNKLFEVSVILPVYNAENYVVRAIESALSQAEVSEIIVVDDGFPDGAFDLCKNLARKESKIKLLTHPNHENFGAGVSRNLGILNSTCEYIAFLDADDYFLPNRFKFTKELFLSNSKIEGVYEPVGIEFASIDAQKKFSEMMHITFDGAKDFINYPLKALEGLEFFESLILLNNGLPPVTDGITVKKHLIARVGLFNSQLRLHQDSEFWIRLSHKGYFASPSNRAPISVRTMHDDNRIYSKNNHSKALFYKSLLAWATQSGIDQKLFNLILSTYQKLLKSEGINEAR